MNNKTKKIFIGVAWPYVNGSKHIGHLAGYLIPCDIFARYSRLKGYDVLMVSGTDCNGTPITVEADKEKITAKEVVEKYTPKIHELISLYGTSYDLFTSTLTENHAKVTKQVFLNLLDNGYILKQKSKQYFSETEDKFLPDRYVEGTCPFCGAKDQRADQCEVCGRTIGLGELVDAKSKLTKSPVTLKETEHYFIDFPKLQNEIEPYVQNSTHWREWVRNETLGFLKEGLLPRAITRDIDWGVEIPRDQIPENRQLEGISNKRFYVWFDAVVGYLSAAIEWAEKKGTDWKEFWINPECKHYYFMGKDNLTFHTIFWPGQLLGQKVLWGGTLNLPYYPSVTQNLNLEGQKFSTSRGITVDAIDVGKHFGVDKVRFYMASILPETKDANWKWEDFQNTVNSELIGNFGNFVNRTLVFLKNKLDGNLQDSNCVLDDQVEEELKNAFAEVNANLEKTNFVSSLNRILKVSKFGNQYFDLEKPWVSIKENRNESEKTLYNCLQIVFSLTMLLYPFIPQSMEKLNKLFLKKDFQDKLFPKQSIDKYQFEQFNIENVKLAETIEPLFQKIEDEQIEEFLGN